MYKLIDTVDNVLTIALCENKIILKRGIDYKENQLELCSSIKEIRRGGIMISENVFNFQVQSEEKLFFKSSSNFKCFEYNLIEQKEFQTHYASYLSELSEITIVEINEEKIMGIDSDSKKIMWQKDELSIRFFQGKNNFFYAYNFSTILKSIDKKTGKDLWICNIQEVRKELKLPISDSETIFQTIHGYWKNNIIVSLSNNLILLIDNKTGAINYHWKNSGITKKPLFWSTCNYLIPSKDKLIGLIDSLYWEINLNTKEVSVHELEGIFKAQKLQAIHLGRAIVRGTNLIFPSDRATVGEKGQTIYNNSIVILDRTNQTIKWKYRFDSPDAQCGGYFGQVEADKNRIYVRTNTNKLYIFEKE
jgi:hypothetical protein